MTTETDASAPRQRNARGEGDRLRTDLLEAAAELMAEHGTIEGISLRAVARRAGVSATAVYRHFDDHTQLLRESIQFCWSNFLDMLAAAQEGATDPFDAFERSGFGYATFAAEHQGQYRVMFSNRIRLVGDTSSIADATFQILVDEVTGMLDVLGDDRDPQFVAVQVHTWIHGIVDLIGCHPEMAWPPIEQQLDGLRHALGLLRPDERPVGTPDE
ncbi:TetR/AcrR family transcriptional regulator [Ilumatobacter coccineus]|uniref:Putative TetR family transcriptional regulator n=1 Tax=Ilumatobacter coccineus (strain NBRC 103263 / KCTC 29153 / YM16-304) TaxID=1313172 RepID=A0A6C7ECR2_ILUCY|nr:TetR/AcrR family transcriptional regulator [Ilumatobacter coccineus]BAN02925.1 putative TetR family transcriptional regulator [Ilumatobacter coccineus YM16-304]